ncbi:MurR/RpiR family transcriptional regulator [Rhodobacteraceae bacterium RKSG542]|uniref:MurR/RpiR family transcriptional regulator n=1 Tax=Pseudovibrio flavus TaxID=2529854 RepID=UPI0012BBB060|nr:MurR/RpiR family transcriptional regulator [Pseudovibrio flavus]MTI15719.1 MurR/RpiR family transcriptional regulator [Pseudovibrio flavus]
MTAQDTIEHRIISHYGELSTQLKIAADFVLDHPVEIATKSLRAVAKDAGLTAPTFSRLARALEFKDYEGLKALCRNALPNKSLSLSKRTGLLQAEAASEKNLGIDSFLFRHTTACLRNLDKLVTSTDQNQLREAALALANARNVLVIGFLSSSGLAEYLGYIGNLIFAGWKTAGRSSVSIASEIAELGEGDMVVLITSAPFSQQSIDSALRAAENGARLVVITDSPACPALSAAQFPFLIGADSPQFFTSHVAFLAFIETLAGMVASHSGNKASERMDRFEEAAKACGVYWKG